MLLLTRRTLSFENRHIPSSHPIRSLHLAALLVCFMGLHAHLISFMIPWLLFLRMAPGPVRGFQVWDLLAGTFLSDLP